MARVASSIPELSRTVGLAFRMLLGLGALAAAGTFLFADVAVSIIFGQGQFDPAILLLKVFAPILPLLFIDTLFGTTLTAVGKTKEMAAVKMVSIAVGAALAFLLIPLCQARYGNGAIGLLLSFGLSEVLMLTAFLVLLPKGTVGGRALLDVVRAAAAAGGTVAAFQVLPQIAPWLGMPASVVLFAALAFAVGLVAKEDVHKLRF
jgi:O-antigen/teichoic acid export membrane protein